MVRFLAKVDFAGPDECWEWTACRHVRMGHGRLVVGGRAGKVEYAHRLAWQYWVGPIPDGLIVRHTCDNPPCCNPAHLILGTQADNALDMVRRRRHGKEKLTPDMVREIRGRPDGPRGFIKAMAAEFGVHPYTIGAVRKGRYRGDIH
jgi:HNH endonuclease